MYKQFTFNELSDEVMKLGALLDSDDYIPATKYGIVVKAFNHYVKILNNAMDTDTTDSVFVVPVYKYGKI